MDQAVLTVTSRNYGSWSLRGFLLCRLAGLDAHGGPFLFGPAPTAADAMYAPVCARFRTYGVDLDPACATYRDTVLALDAMVEWTEAARAEADAIEELDIEF